MDNLKKYLLETDDTVYESVQIPEWENRTVWVRSLTNKEKSQYEDSIIKTKVTRDAKGKQKEKKETDILVVRAKLVCFATCKDKGDKTPVFSPEDYKLLLSKNSAAMERLFDVASKLCRLTSEDVDDLVGNSELDQNADSGSN